MSKSNPTIDSLVPGPIKAGLDEILKKSCRLMARQGFHGTSMRDVAHETGRSLAGLYHYFHSKKDLLFLINYHGFKTLNETWQKMDQAFQRPNEKLYGFVLFHTRYFAEHIDEMRVMTWGTQELPLEKAKMIEKMKARYTGAARDVVRQVYEHMTGEEMEEKQLERETYILFGMMNWIFGWYSPRKHGSVGDLVGDIYRTFIHGFASRQEEQDDLSRIDTSVNTWFRDNGTARMW
jgi:AcrR family transcriptional regulator